jgi:uncharacterized circularly permuted ATP-grasp superfamily protein
MIQEAIDRYHGLLTDEVSADAHEALASRLKADGLYFGERPICRVLRPHFYLRENWDYLTRETEILLNAFTKAHGACLADPALRAQLDLEPYEEELFGVDAYADIPPWTSSRLDAFFMQDSGYLRFVEYNAETPAGIGYGDLLTEAFLQLEPMRLFQQDYVVHAFPGLGHLLGALVFAYKRLGGTENPQIAIVDWQEVPTLNEHEIARQYFERNDVRSVLADPRALEYRDGHLWAGDFRVDLIYKRVLISELIKRMGTDNPIVRAVRDKAVLITNGFSAKLLAKKASLAFLSDEQNSHLFNRAERTVIENHIPWTRCIRERKTVYQKRLVDLVPFIAEHRERFVIKPNDEYGGSGVVLGWEASVEEWNAAIRHALTTPHVVQERVDPVIRDFPMLLDNGTLDISPRFVDADPYVFYGKTVGGCLTRLSSVALLNVTAGGGSVVPMFVIEKR